MHPLLIIKYPSILDASADNLGSTLLPGSSYPEPRDAADWSFAGYCRTLGSTPDIVQHPRDCSCNRNKSMGISQKP